MDGRLRAMDGKLRLIDLRLRQMDDAELRWTRDTRARRRMRCSPVRSIAPRSRLGRCGTNGWISSSWDYYWACGSPPWAWGLPTTACYRAPALRTPRTEPACRSRSRRVRESGARTDWRLAPRI